MNAISDITLGLVEFTVAKWASVRHHLLDAIDRLEGTHTEEDVVAMLLSGRAGLWVGTRCAAVTEITKWPRFSEVNVFIAGGEMNGLKALKPQFEDHARKQGCKRAVIRGRKGWERVHDDYRMSGIVLVKEL